MYSFAITLLNIGLVCTISGQPMPESKAALLTDFETKKIKDGWKSTSSPSTPDKQIAVLCSQGNLKEVAEKQKVTLKYTWVVVSQTIIPADSEKDITLIFNSADSVESKFEILSTTPTLILELDLAKEASQGGDGTKVKLTVQTGKQQSKLILGIQQAVQVYSDEKAPRLLATRYLGRYGTVIMEKNN
jgi:hypothetical protein